MASETKNLTECLNSIMDLEVLDNPYDRKRLSKDFYNYSPILKKILDGRMADIVVRPNTVNSIIAVAKACWSFNSPLTLRGGGTGNYGQAVPLNKGVVMHMNNFNKIEKYFPETGFVKVQSGCLMSDLNKELEKHGRELRLLPSTWKTATIGGFISGGSGGIGSVKWGFLRDPGNLISLEAINVDANPQLLQLDTQESESLNHAYGTNGIITSLVIATDIKKDWYSLVIDCNEFKTAIDLLKTFTSAAIELKLVAILEKEIVMEMPAWFKTKSIANKVLIKTTLGGLSTIEYICKKNHLGVLNLGNERELENDISDLVWNHTTLQMRAKDKNWTYLQMLLPLNEEYKFINSLKKIFDKKILWHLEAVSQQGIPRIAALPVLKWTNNFELNKIIDQCRKYGAIIFNPHVLTVEEGGLGVIDADQVKAKLKYDPKGLLNPGKLQGWESKEKFMN
tara:strand:+ start:1302 stop:2657 length:1356 start_codon:yes stop_codon:yes gene_type:complete